MGVCIFLCFVLVSLILPSKARVPLSEDSLSVRDDSTDVKSGSKFSAEGKGFNCLENVCENAVDYPHKHVAEVVSKLSRNENLFEPLEAAVAGRERRVKRTLRPDGSDIVPLCEVATHVKFPKTMRNEHNITKYIVNDDLNKQGIVFETCRSKNVADAINFPVEYEGVCIQQYSRVRLLAIDPDSKGEPSFDDFIIPSCCVAAMKRLRN